MEANLLLPILLFSIIALSVLIYRRVEEKSKELFGERKFSPREAITTAALIGILITIIGLMPGYAIQILFVAALSYTFFIFAHLFLRKAIISIIPPMIFIAVFLILNNLLIENMLAIILVTDIFAATFAVIAITLIGPLFSWKAMIVFAALLTVIDFTHVFITGHMVAAAGKAVSLNLPLVLLIPRIPSLRGLTVLGLGDIFLSGLFTIQVASKYDLKAGFITALSISTIFLIFDILVSNFILHLRFFPATILVLVGWFIGACPHVLKRRKG